MIGPVTRLPLIWLWRRQICSLTYLGRSSTTHTKVTTCPSASLTHATSPSMPRPPKFNFKRADWATFRGIVDTVGDTMVTNATHAILHAAEACIPNTSTVHTRQSMEFQCGQRIADKYFVRVIGDTGLSASSPVKLTS